MKKVKQINKFILRCFWILVIGSVFGFFTEILYSLVYTRSLEIRRGLIYGPFIQVYGMGALAYYFLIRTEQNPKKVFFKGMILGGALEYLCSFFQELFFGNISWDYSHMILNFNGRTCIQYCFYWGVIGVVFLKAVYPILIKNDKYLDDMKVIIISYILMIFIIYDVAISIIATVRQNERAEGIEARNKFEEYLDQTYPDERLNKIYFNRQTIEGEQSESEKNTS